MGRGGAHEVGGERGLEHVVRAGLRDGRREQRELALREARLREMRHVQLVHNVRAALHTALTHLYIKPIAYTILTIDYFRS